MKQRAETLFPFSHLLQLVREYFIKLANPEPRNLFLSKHRTRNKTEPPLPLKIDEERKAGGNRGNERVYIVSVTSGGKNIRFKKKTRGCGFSAGEKESRTKSSHFKRGKSGYLMGSLIFTRLPTALFQKK